MRLLPRRMIKLKFEHTGDLKRAIEHARASWAASSSDYSAELLALLLVLSPQSKTDTLALNEALSLARSGAERPRPKLCFRLLLMTSSPIVFCCFNRMALFA